MGINLFRRESNEVARRERLDELERRLADRFRKLSGILTKAAELIEARRLQRSGYERPGEFLERVEQKRR